MPHGRASARATALALRKLARATRAVADGQRWRAAALRDAADAFIAEADGADEIGRGSRLREGAARMVFLSEHAETVADLLDRQAMLAVSWAADADERAGERRRRAMRHAG